MRAVAAGELEAAGSLLRNGADVNFKDDKGGDRPLTLAAFKGNLAMLRLLIKEKADVG